MVCACLPVSTYKHWQKKKKRKDLQPCWTPEDYPQREKNTQFNVLCYFRPYLWHLKGAFLRLTSVAKIFRAVAWSPLPTESTVRGAPAVLRPDPGTCEESPSAAGVCFGLWWEPFTGMLTCWKMGEGRFMNKAIFTVPVILCFPH